MAAMRRFNDWLAERVTSGVATMWCAYAFGALAVYGFPWHDLKASAVVQWTSQEFIQLVLLSVIMVGQRVQSDRLSDLHDKHDKLHQMVSGNGESP